MTTEIILASGAVIGLIASFIISRVISRAESEPKKVPDPPPFPPSRWRIRKRNGAWLVHRREWWCSLTDGVMRDRDRYCYAAPTWEAALDYCRQVENEGGDH